MTTTEQGDPIPPDDSPDGFLPKAENPPRKFRAFLLPGKVTSDPQTLLSKLHLKTKAGDLRWTNDQSEWVLDMPGGWQAVGNGEEVGLMVFKSGSEDAPSRYPSLIGSIVHITYFTSLPDFAFDSKNDEKFIRPFAISKIENPQLYKPVLVKGRSKNSDETSMAIFKFGQDAVPKEAKKGKAVVEAVREEDRMEVEEEEQVEDGHEEVGDEGAHEEQSANPSSQLGTTLEAQLVSLFNERPIWMRAALDHRLSQSYTGQLGWRLSAALRNVAYLFFDGPWRKSYVRFGYDPRHGPESARFQVIDFRDPALRGSQPANYSAPGQVNDFRFLIPPVSRSALYQLCDIEDASVQKMLAALPKRMDCHFGSGWFFEEGIDAIREALKVKSETMRRGRVG